MRQQRRRRKWASNNPALSLDRLDKSVSLLTLPVAMLRSFRGADRGETHRTPTNAAMNGRQCWLLMLPSRRRSFLPSLGGPATLAAVEEGGQEEEVVVVEEEQHQKNE